jgi:hypothetical protein
MNYQHQIKLKMQKNITRVILIVVLLLTQTSTDAQPKFIPDALKAKLQGKTKLVDIMKVVDKFYTEEQEGKNIIKKDNEEQEEENAYNHWKRWEWWMSSHLDANGGFVNINQRNAEALNAVDQKWNAEINRAVGATAKSSSNVRDRETGTALSREDGTARAFGDWSVLGPTGDGTGPGDIKGVGRIDRIAFHPTDANTIYVGAPSGHLWKTINGGTNWASVTDGLPAAGIAGVAISPTNGNIIYVLTGDGDSYSPGYLVYDFGSSQASIGVYKSIDGGVSWTKTGNFPGTVGDYEGHRLKVSPTNGNYLMATTSQGIFRTIDGGVSWTQVKTGEHWDIEFKPSSDSTVYATSGGAIFYSTQGGRSGTWNTATTDFSVASARRIELAVSANNANYVYALCGAVPSSGTYTGIFRSVNSGVSFTRRSNTPNILGSSTTGTGTGEQSDYDLGITVKATDAERVAACGLCVWRSNGSNGASTMVSSTIYRESFGAASAYIHPDVHDVQYSPLNGNLYAATDGGFYRSTDDGVTWTILNAGLITTQFFGLAMRDADADGDADGIGFLAGAQDNGMKFRPFSGATVFDHVICCDGYGTAIDADDPNILYMNINGSFYKSINAGVSTTLISSVTFFSPIAIDYLDPDTVYVGGSNTLRSFNGFTSSTSFAGNTRRELTTCPSNQARLYGSAGTNIIRSDDRAATWTTKSGTAGWPVGTFTINDIDPYPTNSLEVYACFGGYSAGNKVMRSTTGGDSWTNWSGSLPNVPTYSLAVATEGVYVGTEIGVFFRGYGMTDWVPFYNDMPRVAVTELEVNNNGFIYASTFGRGAWLGDRRTACNVLETISGALNGAYYYEASDQLNATITATGTNGTEIFMQGGNSVTLNPGFEVKAGAFFKGYIAPCSNGGIPTAARTANNEAIYLPRIVEVNTTQQPALKNTNYYKIANGKIEMHLTKTATIQLLAKQKDNTWLPFYPEQQMGAGLFSLPYPNVYTPEIKILVNNIPLEKVSN